MKYEEYRFEIGNPPFESCADVLVALLGELGFESFVPEESGMVKAYAQLGVVDDESLQDLLTGFPIDGCRITYTKCIAPDEDWNAVWEQEGFEPIVLGNELAVHDPRHTDIPTVARHILIHPRQAFGTGAHQTTRMILRALLELDLTGRKVVDAGTGTGILAIMALMQGAGEVFAYDIDEWSVENACGNLELNGFSGRAKVLQGDSAVLQDVRGVDLLLANINRNILLSDMERFVNTLAPCGELILSGFYAEDVPLLEEKARELNMYIYKRYEDEGWTMLHLRGNS